MRKPPQDWNNEMVYFGACGEVEIWLGRKMEFFLDFLQMGVSDFNEE